MPTYQYACTNPECGERFELVQSFTDPSATECPVCGSPVRKVFSAVGVVFKGSGFYRNDSRTGNGAKTSKDDAKSSGSDTKSESTPAKSNDSKSSGSSGSETKTSSTGTSTSKATSSA